MTRWRDRVPGASAPEDRAATLMREAPAPDEPEVAVLARVERRLFRAAPRRLRGGRWVLRLGLAVAALVAGGASVKAFEWARQTVGLWPRAPLTPAPPRAESKRAWVRGLAPVALPSPVAQTGSSTDQPLNVAPSVSPEPLASDGRSLGTGPRPTSPARARATSRPVTEPSPEPGTAPQPSSVPWPAAGSRPMGTLPAPAANDEIAALDRAMALLRRDRDATAALVALDAYLQRYPNGFLHREALAGRIDALLVLGRVDQALRALDAFPFDQHRRSTELQVIRAELRARADCARAIADFGAALASGPDAALLERILHGRGTCRAKTGDVDGAVADLGRYVERFPDGEHAAWARRWLGSAAHAPKGR